MTIKRYKRGEHPGGFLGYRVTVGSGFANQTQQAWFSERQHGRREAKALARECERKFKKHRDRMKSQRRIYGPAKANVSRTLIPVPGINLQLRYRDLADGGTAIHVGVTLKCWVRHHRYNREFSVSKHRGLKRTLEKSLRVYRDVYAITPKHYTHLRRQISNLDHVTIAKALAARARSQGHAVRSTHFMDILNEGATQ